MMCIKQFVVLPFFYLLLLFIYRSAVRAILRQSGNRQQFRGGCGGSGRGQCGLARPRTGVRGHVAAGAHLVLEWWVLSASKLRLRRGNRFNSWFLLRIAFSQVNPTGRLHFESFSPTTTQSKGMAPSPFSQSQTKDLTRTKSTYTLCLSYGTLDTAEGTLKVTPFYIPVRTRF